MDWYEHYMKEVNKISLPKVFSHRDLYISLCIALSESKTGTMDKLIDLTRAYLEHDEVVSE